ncbi:hypothetical protein BC629DRAFT_1547168 [Irpex lacteus]|nr:hypothetical protein BC629DRAFT_1547168 [Irpex lacteus]
MAEAVFDEHPLGEYFRESGEIQEVMPGSHPEYSAEPSTDGVQQHAVGSFVLRIIEQVQVCACIHIPIYSNLFEKHSTPATHPYSFPNPRQSQALPPESRLLAQA